ncbi:MAG TPA: ABC transporter permease [Chloroflexota bacterium]|jgi:NitT/TauT family transport system permease protein
MDDGAIGAISVHREPTRVQAWLSRLFPIAVTFIVLMILWYGAAIYFNLRYLNIHMQDVDPNAWNRLSTGDKVRQALSTGQPLMPTPIQTIGDFITRLSQKPTAAGGLWVDVYWTGHAAVLGFLLGTFIGIALAVVFMSSRLLARSLMPFVVASQTIPIVALVPAIMVSLGLGLRSEVLISAYLAFFSITISTYKGLQSVQPLAFELMRSYAANPRQVFLKLRLPAALPFLFTGLKIGVTASLVGAIIAELPSGSPHGLGQALLNASQYSLNILLWSTVLSAALLGLALYGAVVIAERVIVRWHVENPA